MPNASVLSRVFRGSMMSVHRADQVCTRAARCSVVAPHVTPLPTVQVAELLDANNLLCSLPPQSTALLQRRRSC